LKDIGLHKNWAHLPVMRSPSIVSKLRHNLFLSHELKSVLDATDICHSSRYSRKSSLQATVTQLYKI